MMLNFNWYSSWTWKDLDISELTPYQQSIINKILTAKGFNVKEENHILNPLKSVVFAFNHVRHNKPELMTDDQKRSLGRAMN